MASPSMPLERSLAYWKKWWGAGLAEELAQALHDHIDPTKLPGKGCLLSTSQFNGTSLKDSHVAAVSEALLLKYPPLRQPSGYMLGDAVLALDVKWNGGLLGGPQTSILKENQRREAALAEGGKLKRLLSYNRTGALKAENGKTPEITYLKALANKRLLEAKRSPASSASSSPRSFYSGTTMVLG